MLYWITALIFLGLPLGMAMFLLWRAYQLGVRGRTHLVYQWWTEKNPNLEQFAKLLAFRDLVFALGCLTFLVLILALPTYIAAWASLLAAFGFVHQGFTYYAVHKAKRRRA